MTILDKNSNLERNLMAIWVKNDVEALCVENTPCLPIQPLSHCDRAPLTLRFSRYCMVIQPLLQRNMTDFVMYWPSISCVIVKLTRNKIVCSISTCRTVGRASKWSITRLQFPKGQGRRQTVPIVGADDSLRPYPHTFTHSPCLLPDTLELVS